MSSQACLDNISKESHDLGYCFLICNSYIEGFKLLYNQVLKKIKIVVRISSRMAVIMTKI